MSFDFNDQAFGFGNGEWPRQPSLHGVYGTLISVEGVILVQHRLDFLEGLITRMNIVDLDGGIKCFPLELTSYKMEVIQDPVKSAKFRRQGCNLLWSVFDGFDVLERSTKDCLGESDQTSNAGRD